jgi:hypothetical protein
MEVRHQLEAPATTAMDYKVGFEGKIANTPTANSINLISI